VKRQITACKRLTAAVMVRTTLQRHLTNLKACSLTALATYEPEDIYLRY
jgi:hypothetical protein